MKRNLCSKLFNPNIIPSRERNWMCRRTPFKQKKRQDAILSKLETQDRVKLKNCEKKEHCFAQVA